MSNEGPPCGLDVALAVMGGKWKPLILYHLNSGSKLRELAAAGVLTRHDYQRVPPMVDYTMMAFKVTPAFQPSKEVLAKQAKLTAEEAIT